METSSISWYDACNSTTPRPIWVSRYYSHQLTHTHAHCRGMADRRRLQRDYLVVRQWRELDLDSHSDASPLRTAAVRAWTMAGETHPWLLLSSESPRTHSPAARAPVGSWFARLVNSYHSSRIAFLTVLTGAFFVLLWIASVNTAQLSSWLSLESMTALVGLCALPRFQLYTLSRDGRPLGRSLLLRACELIVSLQRLAWFGLVLTAVLSIWMLSEVSDFVIADRPPGPRPKRRPPPAPEEDLRDDVDLYAGSTHIAESTSFWLGLIAIALVFLQAKQFDRLRAHEQLQLGFGLDPSVIATHRPLTKSPKRSVSWIAGPNHHLRRADLRLALYDAAVHSDATRTRELLEVVEKKLSSKTAVRRLLLKMYATPTLWLWWFAVSTLNPLHVACRQGDANLVRILLDAGMDPNALDKTHGERLSLRLVYDVSQGRLGNLVHVLGSPLHVAVASQHTDLIDVLVDAGADIDLVARSSFFSHSKRVSPVFLVDSVESMERLIHHGANFLLIPGTRDHMNVTVLQRAIVQARNDLAAVVREWGGDVALTPLHAACAAGDGATVRRFLSRGVPPDSLGEFVDGLNRRTPLHWASIMGRAFIVKLLIDYGADIDAIDADGRTPLHWAAKHDRVDTVAELLRTGADPNITDSDGLTALAFGVAGGRIRSASVGLFVAAGVDVNERQLNTAGDTCLHLALRGGHQASALALVESGRVNLRATNDDGVEAVECCASAELQFTIKTRGGWTDVVVVYDARDGDAEHALLAQRVRHGIEESLMTVWMRASDTSAELDTSLRVITGASAVVCVLSPGFESNAACMEELAFAKARGVAVMAITMGSIQLSEELQVYLFTRQLIPFRDGIVGAHGYNGDDGDDVDDVDEEEEDDKHRGPERRRLKLRESKFQASLGNLIDGLRDEVELHRLRAEDARHGAVQAFQTNRALLMTSSFLGRELMTADDDEASPHPWIFDMAPPDSRSSHGVLVSPALIMRQTSEHRSTIGSSQRSLRDLASVGMSRRRLSVIRQSHVLKTVSLSVFLSHGDCHTELAHKIRDELERRQCTVTVDSMTEVSSLKERIVAAKDAILQCDVFVVVLSAESVRTELVNDQLAFAEDKGKRIVPVYVTTAPSVVDGVAARMLEQEMSELVVLGDDLSYGRGADDLVRKLDSG